MTKNAGGEKDIEGTYIEARLVFPELTILRLIFTGGS